MKTIGCRRPSPLSAAVHADTRHAGWSSNLRCGPVWVRHVRSLFLSPRNCSAEYIALRRRMVTSHQSEGTVERGSQKPLSKMLGRRCSAFSAARAPGLVHDRDQERALPLPGLQAPFLPVCWQTVPVHIQSGHGDGTGGVRDRLTEIGDDYIALPSVACAICEETKECFFRGDSSTHGARSRSPRGVRNAMANDCPSR